MKNKITVLFKIIFTILTISLIINIHEFGHFITALLFGFPVEEYSIGFGPSIFQYVDSNNITYSIRAILFGGYNSIDFYDEKIKYIEYANIKKIIILLSGIVFNILVGFFSFVLYIKLRGLKYSKTIVINKNKENINNNLEYVNNLVKHKKKYDIRIKYRKISFYIAYKYAVRFVFDELFDEIKSDIKIETNVIKRIENSSGNLGIFRIFYSIIELGKLEILNMFSCINISIAIFNILPIPILDGGRILLVIAEMINGGKLDDNIELVYVILGLSIIIILLIIGFIKDIISLFRFTKKKIKNYNKK